MNYDVIMSINQKGLTAIFIIVSLLVFSSAIGGAYFFGTQSKAPVPSPSLGPSSTPSVAPILSPLPSQTAATPSPSAQASVVTTPVTAVKTELKITSTVLNNSLPSGWKTINSANNSFQVGYDPNLYEGEQTASFADSINIERSKECCFNFNINIKPYNGGSRHSFIGNYDKTPQTYEKDYYIKGRNGLVIYNIISSSASAIGMVNIDGKRAFYLTFYGSDQAYIEKVLASLRVLP
jgi:hypothetical protein